MIKTETLLKDWIISVTEKYNYPDPLLVEKAIRSLYLLEQLILNKVDFILKGETSLIISLPEPGRLSIDIDIIITGKTDNLDGVFSKIFESTDFLSFTEVFRDTSSKIEKAHYKFYYKPKSVNIDREEPLLLDILFEPNPYPQIQKIELVSSIIQYQEPGISVTTPTLASILGDKLTAFAPGTTGIPYFKNKESMSLQIAKQLFDIGTLFDYVEDFKEVSEAFKNITEIEPGDRNLLLAIKSASLCLTGSYSRLTCMVMCWTGNCCRIVTFRIPLLEPQEIIFEAYSDQAPYLKTKPLHHSQEVVIDDNEGTVFKIRIVPNFELEQEFLAFGERVKILEPDIFKNKISERLYKSVEGYESTQQ